MGSLKEPLVNRCIPLIFSPYSNAELLEMCKDRLVEFNLSEEKIQSIVNRCRGNPRVLNVLCRRLFYLLSYNLPKDVSALDNLIQEVLNLDTSGMSPMEYNYLEFLSNNGGRASLSLLVNGLHLSRDTILRDIEPQLIYNKLIRITSKGREINENNLELHGI
jgi:Holliday junction resolvasome RuvABC ATP-dependent DNA helicase subunit